MDKLIKRARYLKLSLVTLYRVTHPGHFKKNPEAELCYSVISTSCKDDHTIIKETLNHNLEGSSMELLMC
ncbi:hypothetical protein DPMN_000587 [Dreissena polymorpha]|uniref:Uncharacterized protein n=1 Tax=Dreissena polymorpha TaxID=45954 RepID=A0A9D4RS89_DREPO|nr:hypothetical protein DPMN_000587 [Dreissena polymorpha]